jgi:peptidoglycan/LPS O-acetylase OafA/YrhL
MTLYFFVSGMLTAGFLAAALFFLRFWRRTRDPLFMSFSGAFALLAIGQAVLALSGLQGEARSWIYLIRLAAFLMILGAIYRKNRERTPRRER